MSNQKKHVNSKGSAFIWILVWLAGVTVIAWVGLNFAAPRFDQKLQTTVQEAIATLGSGPVEVSTHGRNIKLTGRIGSEKERQLLLAAVNSAPGVGNVRTKFTIVDAPSKSAISSDTVATNTVSAAVENRQLPILVAQATALPTEPTLAQPSTEAKQQKLPPEPVVADVGAPSPQDSESNDLLVAPSISIKVFDNILSIEGTMSTGDDTAALVKHALDSFNLNVVSNGLILNTKVANAQWLTSLQSIMPLMSGLSNAQMGIVERQLTLSGLAPSREVHDAIIYKTLASIGEFSLVEKIDVQGEVAEKGESALALGLLVGTGSIASATPDTVEPAQQAANITKQANAEGQTQLATEAAANSQNENRLAAEALAKTELARKARIAEEKKRGVVAAAKAKAAERERRVAEAAEEERLAAEALAKAAAAEEDRLAAEARAAAQQLKANAALAKAAAAEEDRLAAETAASAKIVEQKRLAAEALVKSEAAEEERLIIEAAARAKAVEEERLATDALVKAKTAKQERLAAEALAEAKAAEQQRLVAEAAARAKAAERLRLATEATAKKQANEQARRDAIAAAKLRAATRARANAETAAATQARAEELARLRTTAAARAAEQAELKVAMVVATELAQTKQRGGKVGLEQSLQDLPSLRILFGTENNRLTIESLDILDQIAKIMIQYPDTQISIEGHTDATGELEQNLQLSLLRATTVRDYLIRQGVSVYNLRAIGIGEAVPLVSNDTPVGRAKNRRIEFTFR